MQLTVGTTEAVIAAPDTFGIGTLYVRNAGATRVYWSSRPGVTAADAVYLEPGETLAGDRARSLAKLYLVCATGSTDVRWDVMN